MPNPTTIIFDNLHRYWNLKLFSNWSVDGWHYHGPCIQESGSKYHDRLTRALFQLQLDRRELLPDYSDHPIDLFRSNRSSTTLFVEEVDDVTRELGASLETWKHEFKNRQWVTWILNLLHSHSKWKNEFFKFHRNYKDEDRAYSSNTEYLHWKWVRYVSALWTLAEFLTLVNSTLFKFFDNKVANHLEVLSDKSLG